MLLGCFMLLFIDYTIVFLCLSYEFVTLLSHVTFMIYVCSVIIYKHIIIYIYTYTYIYICVCMCVCVFMCFAFALFI